jgi:hypothetical protein
VDIFWSLDDGFILEYGGDDRVSDGAPGGEELLSEERDVTRDGEECQYRLVRVDR